jgi:toxin FitB
LTILDTNVLSEAMSPTPSPKVAAWMTEQRLSRELYLTTITVAEILYGIELLPHGKLLRGRMTQLWPPAMFRTSKAAACG